MFADVSESELDAIRERFKYETPFYALTVAKILNKRKQLVPLDPYPYQRRLDAKLEAQRAAGMPMRVLSVKARQMGISTWVVAKMMQRVTQMRYQEALIIAHENDTAGKLFGMQTIMYANLPTPAMLGLPIDLKPDIVHKRDSAKGEKYVLFGERAKPLRDRGELGLNSSIEIDTAKNVAGGRGYTPTILAGTEVAHWEQPDKLLGLMNGVPDTPETLIALETTANGFNFFEKMWREAEEGQADPATGTLFTTFFAGWTEDPTCVMPFSNADEEAEFAESIGEGPYGEAEPHLVEHFGCTPAQLRWRRIAIRDKCRNDLELFKQEFPSTSNEAFIGSGRPRFSGLLISAATKRAMAEPGPQTGILVPGETVTKRTRGGSVEIPTKALWVPAAATGFGSGHPYVLRWEEPYNPDPAIPLAENERPRPGQYVVGVDTAGDDVDEAGETAYHAIQVIDHETRLQVAEYRTRGDKDDFRDLVLLVAIYYNRALLAVEITGDWGVPVIKPIQRDYRYEMCYRRKAPKTREEKNVDLLGWQTTTATKNDIETNLLEMLKEDVGHGPVAGIRSQGLISEFRTYMLNDAGRAKALPGAHDDRLLAYMIAQYVAGEVRPRQHRGPARPTGRGAIVRDPLMGY